MAALTPGHVTRATRTSQWLPTLGYNDIEREFWYDFLGAMLLFLDLRVARDPRCRPNCKTRDSRSTFCTNSV